MGNEQRRPLSESGAATSHQLEFKPAGGRPIGIVLERLQGLRRSGQGWSARCPSHSDRVPSLSVKEGGAGRVLLTCHAGCSVGEVVQALGLELTELFPRDTRRPSTPRPRRARVTMPESVASILTQTAEFGIGWEISKALAPLEPHQQHADNVRSWEYITSQADVRTVLQLANLIRGIAIFRYCTFKSIEDPAAIRRAVRRLLDEMEPPGEAA